MDGGVGIAAAGGWACLILFVIIVVPPVLVLFIAALLIRGHKKDADHQQAEKARKQYSIPSQDGGTREMIAWLSPNLAWVDATPNLQKYLGWSIDELKGLSILQFVNPDDIPLLKEAFEQALQHGVGCSVEVRLQLCGGTERHVQIDTMTHYTAENKPLHLRCHFQDITGRICSDAELRVRAEQLTLAKNQGQFQKGRP